MIKSFLITLAVILCCELAVAQQRPPRHAASDFNIELLNFEGPSRLEAVPGGGAHSGLIATRSLRRIATWKPSAEASNEVAALKVEYWMEHSAVKVEVIAYVGNKMPDPLPADLGKLQQVTIATRLVRENESSMIDETELFGIEAIGLRVFRSNPWSIGPPEITNRTQALSVTGVSEERPAYLVTIRNVSQKCITFVRWYGIEGGHKRGGSGVASKCLVPAGGVFDLRQPFALDTQKEGAGVQPHLPEKREIVIESILFDDGSFEGGADSAAETAAHRVGEKIQSRRLLPLLEVLSSAPVEDLSQSLAKLKQDISALSEEVDNAQVEELVQRFSSASPEVRQRRIKEELRNGLRFVKRELRNRIERFEYERQNSPQEADFTAWLKFIKTIYEN
ncbi:MAG: hypothetical protein M3R68_01465 [Acidobacteriota bacterium]|nr:hypothetical protein [Acidobacteriota bacterium]